MLRSELVRLLNARRDNDVWVSVPTGGSERTRLKVTTVGYHPLSDSIEIRTETWWGPEPLDQEVAP